MELDENKKGVELEENKKVMELEENNNLEKLSMLVFPSNNRHMLSC